MREWAVLCVSPQAILAASRRCGWYTALVFQPGTVVGLQYTE
jgi:hypothetical protein